MAVATITTQKTKPSLNQSVLFSSLYRKDTHPPTLLNCSYLGDSLNLWSLVISFPGAGTFSRLITHTKEEKKEKGNDDMKKKINK